jgi:peptidase E
MKLYLASSVHAVARDIAKKEDLVKGNKLVFVTTPAEPKEDGDDLEWLRNDRQALVNAGFEVQDYTITGKIKDEIVKDLKDFDYIYMSGGDA